MATISTNLFKIGLKILLDAQPYSIVENEFVKPGKGQAFNRVKIKNLLNGRVLEKTFKSGESVEVADVAEQEMQYLYNDDQLWHFMDPSTYEQIAADKAVVQDIAMWLKEQEMCTLTLWNEKPILVTPPNFVVFQIVETPPDVRGDTVAGSKPATLENGIVIQVPFFVKQGEQIRVDTRTKAYMERVK